MHAIELLTLQAELRLALSSFPYVDWRIIAYKYLGVLHDTTIAAMVGKSANAIYSLRNQLGIHSVTTSRQKTITLEELSKAFSYNSQQLDKLEFKQFPARTLDDIDQIIYDNLHLSGEKIKELLLQDNFPLVPSSRFLRKRKLLILRAV